MSGARKAHRARGHSWREHVRELPGSDELYDWQNDPELSDSKLAAEYEANVESIDQAGEQLGDESVHFLDMLAQSAAADSGDDYADDELQALFQRYADDVTKRSGRGPFDGGRWQQ